MKKGFAFICVVLALSSFASASALADTNIYFSSHRAHLHKRYTHRHHSLAHRVWAAPLSFALSYSYVPRPYISYQTKIVRPVIVTPPPEIAWQAVPASEVYATPTGETCREYQAIGNVAGGMQSLYGTACLQPDGSWRIVE